MQVLASLLGCLRGCLEGFPDKRRGANTTYRIADFGMAAFSAFFMQSPSFLDHQRRLENEHARSNCQTLFDLPKIPTDNQIRDMLDPAEPELLHPVFAEPLTILESVKGGFDPFQRLGGHVLIALDGTEYFSSKKIHCHNCSTRQRGKGEKEYFHTMLGATLVAPGHDKVIPLEPEFIAPQDGAEKQHCENTADGSRPTASSMPGSTRFISATISSPANPCASKSSRSTGISSSSASHPLIP